MADKNEEDSGSDDDSGNVAPPMPPSGPKPPKGPKPDKKQGSEQSALQRRIFTRWVNQKLKKKGLQIGDIVSDMGDGEPLVKLLENLAEVDYPHKKTKFGTTMRVKQMNNASEALDWVFKDLKVELQMKPSAENLVDGEETPILGLIWAIMLKFLKLEDDEPDSRSLNFKDSLLMWFQNQLKGYTELHIQDLTKSWRDGIALCAIVHKFRPKLMPQFSELKPQNDLENLRIAFEAANLYFGLEEYVSAGEIEQMDEKCMTVYLADWYYGVAEARKVDLAARRIHKLIEFTTINDGIRAKYAEKGSKLKEQFASVFAMLGDTKIDNNMAGARARLSQFNQYKSMQKGTIYVLYYECENLYAELAPRLKKHNRPEFKAESGCAVPELKSQLTDMEKQEKQRNVELQAELSRQIKLAKVYELYSAQYNNCVEWIKDKKAYLSEATNILSVGAAQAALNSLAAYQDDFKAINRDVVTLMNSEATELLDNKFEHSETVSTREAEVSASLKELEELSAKKKALHEDDLAREIYKAQVRGWAADHLTSYTKLEAFIKEKEVYLAKKEDINSTEDAQLHISLLEYYNEEEKIIRPKLEPLQAVGAQVLGAEYKTDLSQWKYETPEDITTRELFVSTGFSKNQELAVTKMVVLKDDLAREQYKQEIAKINRTHKDKFGALQRFYNESFAYLETKEPVASIAEAEMNVAAHVSYQASQKDQESNAYPSLKSVGELILSAEYKTDLSQWKFPTPEEVKERETTVSTGFEKLTKISNEKMLVLEDDLTREQFKAKLRLWNLQHTSLHDQLSAWIKENKAYLEKKDDCDSVADAHNNLKVFDAYTKDKADITSLQYEALFKFGKNILSEKYKSDLSAWEWETPDDVKARDAYVAGAWTELDALSAIKKGVLDENLKNELRKEELRVEFAQVASAFSRWARDVVGEAKSAQFGLTLAEVEAFGAVLDKKHAEVEARTTTDKSQYEKTNKEMTELGVTVNPYTEITMAALEQSQTAVAEAVKARKAAYDVELAKQRRDDELCRALAALVDPFMGKIQDTRTGLETSQEPDEDQVKKVIAFLSEQKEQETKLAAVTAAQDEVNKAGILYNPHTLNTGEDATVVFQQYSLYLDNKKSQLEKEIEARVMRGVTKEQYEEIRQQWLEYDRDGNGHLDRREFKACLYSLGEERQTKETIAIMEQFGEGKGLDAKIKYEGFKEFMIQQLGDTDTEELIVEGFELINRQADKIVDKLIEMVMSPEDCAYIKNTHPDGDYEAWSASVFAR
eukprot:gb/GEZN01000620.1/.p1 GENE.gb/GEZN01000620.1/~~gb/GEZN01000620.1/.p1  ORF type:complete len:1267 (+),score=297.19 gb/GEZN01000620.1/:91-3891(+)